MRRTLEIARGEIGVSEDPPNSNRGKRIEQYLSSTNLKGGYPWCAAFVTWCVKQVEAEMQICTALPHTAYTPHYMKAPGVRLLKDTEDITPGELFLLYYKKLGRVGHIGFIEGPDPDNPKRVLTIEGNSNDDGAREGYEVCRRSRRISSLFALINY